MEDDQLTPVKLVDAGRMLQQSCFDCDFSSPLALSDLANNPFTASQSLADLLKMGVIRCSVCNSTHVVLASTGDRVGGGHLLLARNPYPTGELANRKNVSIQGSSKSVFIPYGCDGKDPSARAPFADLKQHPELLDALPEITTADLASDNQGGNRSFRQLVSTVNRTPALISLGCAWESSPYEDQYLTYGYVDVARYPLPGSAYSTIESLSPALMENLCPGADPACKYILTIKLGIYQLRPIFVLDIEAIAAGPTEQSSYLAWEAALNRLSAALANTGGQ